MFRKFFCFQNLKNISLLRKSDCFSSKKIESFLLKYSYSKNTKTMEPEPKKEDVKEVKEVKPKEVKEIPLGTVEDFIKMDIRVGEITECWKVKHQ